MKINARFEYVSEGIYGSNTAKIILPKRATAGSAGYDFFAPVTFMLEPDESITVPTGIRAYMEEGYVLLMFPRSGLGFKYKLRLDNTVGVIDSDYYFSSNEGHIIVKMTNCGTVPLRVEKDQAFCQGVFVPFGVIDGDDCDKKRDGGFGSTSN